MSALDHEVRKLRQVALYRGIDDGPTTLCLLEYSPRHDVEGHLFERYVRVSEPLMIEFQPMRADEASLAERRRLRLLELDRQEQEVRARLDLIIQRRVRCAASMQEGSDG